MLKVGVMISGGGTNLQVILNTINNGNIRNAKVEVVISNNRNAYILEQVRSHGVQAIRMSPKGYESREVFNEALLQKTDELQLDLIVLAGSLVMMPEAMAKKHERRIINTHPSLIPSFCSVGYYGLEIHEAALACGVEVTGATVHCVDSGMDIGPIISQKAAKVQEGDTPETLQRQVMEQAEWVIPPQAVDIIANGT